MLVINKYTQITSVQYYTMPTENILASNWNYEMEYKIFNQINK